MAQLVGNAKEALGLYMNVYVEGLYSDDELMFGSIQTEDKMNGLILSPVIGAILIGMGSGVDSQ